MQSAHRALRAWLAGKPGWRGSPGELLGGARAHLRQEGHPPQPLVAVQAMGRCQAPLRREKAMLHCSGGTGGGSRALSPAPCCLRPRPPHPCPRSRGNNSKVWIHWVQWVQVTRPSSLSSLRQGSHNKCSSPHPPYTLRAKKSYAVFSKVVN